METTPHTTDGPHPDEPAAEGSRQVPGDLVLRLDAAFRIVHASSASRLLLGCDPHELRHVPCERLLHPADVPAMEACRAAVHRGEEASCHIRLRRRGGPDRPGHLRFYPVGSAGGPAEVVAVWREAGSAGPSQQELDRLKTERDALYHTLMKVPAFMATLRGPDHIIEYVNERYYQLVGRRDLIGRPLFEALPEITHQAYPSLLDQAYRTGEVFEGHELPIQLQRLPGSPLENRYIDIIYQPLCHPDGTISGLLVHGVDVTEKVLTRRRLEVLRQIDQAIVSMETPERVAEAALDHLIAFTGATGAALMIFDEEGAAGRVLAGYPDDGIVWFADDAGRFPLTMLTEAQFIRRGETLYVADLPGTPHRPLLMEGALQSGIRSLLLIPLSVHEERIGCLGLASDVPEAFSPYMRDVAEETAKTLVIALHSAQLLEQVQASREQLRQLSHRLVRVQEEERKYLALELHDQIGQQLLSIQLTLEQVMAQAGKEPVRAAVRQASEIVEKLTNQVRTLSLDLRPSLLDDLGLLAALSWYLHRYTEQTGITIDFKHAGLADQRFPIEIETTAYRIVQEALTNAGRHAGTGRITVQVLVQESLLLLRIEDYGSGFDPASVEVSGGLSGMRERISLVGGELVVEAAPGEGVTILAGIPLAADPADA